MSSRAVDKYLHGHAQPEAAAVSLRDAVDLQHVLAVPAYDERAEDFELLDRLPAGGRILAVVLVNDRDDSPPGVAERNRSFVSSMRSRYGPGRAVGAVASEHRTAFGGLLLMRRTADTLPLPAGEGVGLARKLACDVALSLRARGQLAADVIHCTDADARLPLDYFGRVAPRADRPHAAVYPFRHVGRDGALHRAGQLYELSLRYYVLGLQRAGSPYAMHTIGSTIAVSMTAYAAVRGFPRRHGAEDFYLLNKLAKVGPVERLGGAPIELRDRVSNRIPFGTGPAVGRILEGEPRRFYHPRTFELLGDFLRGLSALARGGGAPIALELLASALYPRLPAELGLRLADASGIESALVAAFARGSEVGARSQHLHTWFDAFRTLKWVHAVRASTLPELAPADAVAGLLGRSPGTLARDLESLRALEDAECRGEAGAGCFDFSEVT